MFLHDIRSKRPFTQLRIDNLMRSVQDPVTIDETNMTDHDFSQVHLFGRAALNMAVRKERTVLKMTRLFGDRTGLLHARANQTFYLEASATEHSVSKPAVNLRIDKDAEMVFGASLYVIGDGAKATGQITGDSSFTINGRMIDVTHLFITKRLKSRFLSHAHSADLHNGTLTVSAIGSFVLATFEIQDGSEVLFPDVHGMQCTVGLVHMKYGSVIFADTYRIAVTSLLLETGSTITASGKDRPASYETAVLPSSCRGSGGSYGSKGGKGKIVIASITECVVSTSRNLAGSVSSLPIAVFINFPPIFGSIFQPPCFEKGCKLMNHKLSICYVKRFDYLV